MPNEQGNGNNIIIIAIIRVCIIKLRLCSYKCFDLCMFHNITVASEGAFICDLCLVRNDYTVFNSCASTKLKLVF